MWLVRELVRLVVRIVVIAAVAFLIALVLAVATSGSFDKDARIMCIAIGCILLAMAGVGSGSNVERFMDQNVTFVAWGSIPGFDAMRPRGEDPRLAPGAALFVSGLVVVALGVLF
ncbi:MAG TPA: hypothetical protein VI408_11360 [Gaiellaceae bacterium]